MHLNQDAAVGVATCILALFAAAENPFSRAEFGNAAVVQQRLPKANSPDSLRQLLEELEEHLEPVVTWRKAAEAALRADSAKPRADSVFLELRRAFQDTVRQATRTLYGLEFQRMIWPEGVAANNLRRIQGQPEKSPEPAEIALADTVKAFLSARGVWSGPGEGTTYFSASDARLFAWLGRFVTPHIRAFLLFEAYEQENPFAEDGSLMVTADHLAQRLLSAQALLEEFPDSPARDHISFRYHQYLASYLGGLGGSAFDWRTRRLSPQLRLSHEEFLRRHGSTEAGRVLAQYVILLKRSGYRRTPEVDEFLRARWDAVRRP